MGAGEGRVATLHEEAQAAAREAGARWWWFRLVGIAWLVIAMVVLRMNLTSVTTGVELVSIPLCSRLLQI
jgi:hypothetical protein